MMCIFQTNLKKMKKFSTILISNSGPHKVFYSIGYTSKYTNILTINPKRNSLLHFATFQTSYAKHANENLLKSKYCSRQKQLTSLQFRNESQNPRQRIRFATPIQGNLYRVKCRILRECVSTRKGNSLWFFPSSTRFPVQKRLPL